MPKSYRMLSNYDELYTHTYIHTYGLKLYTHTYGLKNKQKIHIMHILFPYKFFVVVVKNEMGAALFFLNLFLIFINVYFILYFSLLFVHVFQVCLCMFLYCLFVHPLLFLKYCEHIL